MSTPHVLIIGAGLGGLCLAQGLKRHGISFSVYESDASAAFRAQGYRIRINADGADALQRMLDPELWDMFERTCATIKLGFSRFDAIDGAALPPPPGFRGNRDLPRSSTLKRDKGPYNVDRTTLRSLLLLGLESHVHFDHRFEKYTILPDGLVEVHFSNGKTAQGSFLVGAEGFRSPIRRSYLPHQTLVDTEGRAIYGKTTLNDSLKTRFPADAVQNITVVADDTPLTLFMEPVRFPSDIAVTSQGRLPHVDDYIYWVLTSRAKTFNLPDDELLNLSPEQAAKLSLDLTSHWSDKFRSLLSLQDMSQSRALRIASALPNAEAWPASQYLTLLGDAIHAMSPTGGVGANTALGDAANLCKIIVEDGISAENIGKYEQEMREYAQVAIQGSAEGGKRFYDMPPFEECKVLRL